MSDDKSKRGPADRRQIDIEDEHEVQYWSEVLGVTPDRLRVVVGKVGPMADRVRDEIRK